MKGLLSKLLLTVSILVLASSSSAFAAKPQVPAPSSSTVLGIDVSYPQCGKTLPTDYAFAIVGINGGTAASANNCLADQLVWASKSSGITVQPKRQVYVNTANPGEFIGEISTWPISSYDSNGRIPQNPYGTCDGANSHACSWLYGWNRSIYTESLLKSAAASKKLSETTSDYVWWLDVETMNTWQSGSVEALQRNAAAIEGFGAYYLDKGAKVGIYSTAYQWSQIAGTVSSTSNLVGLDNWRPGGANQSTAKQACTATPLTPGGRVVLTQYISKSLDYNVSCIK